MAPEAEGNCGKMPMTFLIDRMQRLDWAKVRSIYADGLASGLAAFMTSAPDWKTWDAAHLAIARFVARQDGAVLGWAALARAADT